MLMKMNIGYALVVFIFSFVRCQECDIKSDEIDFEKLEGTTWYEVLHIDDGADVFSPCCVLQFFEPSESGSKMKFTTLDFKNPSNASYTQEEFLRHGSNYIVNKNAKEWLRKLHNEEKLKNGGKLPSFIPDDEKEFTYPTILYTDYKNYLIGILCASDKRYVWGTSLRNEVTTEDVLAVHNLLAEKGIQVKLSASKCPQISNIETYLK